MMTNRNITNKYCYVKHKNPVQIITDKFIYFCGNKISSILSNRNYLDLLGFPQSAYKYSTIKKESIVDFKNPNSRTDTTNEYFNLNLK